MVSYPAITKGTPMTIRESKLVVFVLGAGASVWWGPPVMREFLDCARRRYFKLQRESKSDAKLLDCYDSLFQFHNRYKESLWAIERDWDNIEELYTQADLLKLASQRMEDDDLCRKIAWVIWDIYRIVAKTDFSKFAGVVKRISEAGLRPAVVTTNYDLICELSTIESPFRAYYPGFGLETNYGIVKEDAATLTPIPMGSDTLPVIKLHGSVNWFQTAGYSLALADGADVRSLAVEKDQSPIAAFDHLTQRLKCASLDDIRAGIIPPMLGKTSVEPVIAHQWQSAISALSQARQVWLIGYSFPQTDAFMSRLLTEGMRQNEDFQRMVVIDVQPAKDHGVNRVVSPHFQRKRLEYVQLPAVEAFSIMGQEAFEAWMSALRRKEEARLSGRKVRAFTR